MRKIWIDCDTGTDDAVALLTATYLKEKLECVGVSSVGGNTRLEWTFPNTRNVLSLVGREDIPVFKGAAQPLQRELVTATYVHGENGLNGASLPASSAPFQTKQAWEAMADALEKTEDSLEIIAVGPFTNVALLLKERPDLKEKIARILVMGGSLSGGNITPHAEFNIYVDPEAANIVFTSGIEVIMFGLDVTEKGYLNKEEFFTACSGSSKKSAFFAEMFQKQKELFAQDPAYRKYFHDVNPLLYLVEPDLYQGKWAHISVDCQDGETCGKTVSDLEEAQRKENPRTFVVLDVDRQRFARRILEVLEV